jgi:CBS-domain-containing membrane protein
MSPRTPRRSLSAAHGRLAAALSAGTVMLTAVLLLVTVERITGLGVFALPFVASAAVIAMAPTAPLARPAAVIPSYGTATTTAVTVASIVGPSRYAATAAASLSLIIMLLLGAPHAPAAVAAAAIELNDSGPSYLLTSVLPAVLIVVGTALVAARWLPSYTYPASWR